tara:strand:+ start:1848 stop:2246 length:399 start_codon:yes stop_codon:yes gene_type:complete
MTRLKDDIEVAKYEKAISQKYGKEAIQNPLASWADDKEQDYLQQSEELYKRQQKLQEQSDKVEIGGFLLSKKLVNKNANRTCPVCEVYSFELKDDVYMSKFDCCFNCYIQFIEGREERWEKGWRPNNENNQK